MRSSTLNLLLATLLVVVFLGFNSLFVISEGNVGIVTRFGKVVRDSEAELAVSQPGLHFKIPFIDKVRVLDARIQTLSARADRFVTAEKKDLIIDSYVKWRISDPSTFYLTTAGGNIMQAEELLRRRINNSLRSQIGRLTIHEIVSGQEKAPSSSSSILNRDNAAELESSFDSVSAGDVAMADLKSAISDTTLRTNDDTVNVNSDSASTDTTVANADAATSTATAGADSADAAVVDTTVTDDEVERLISNSKREQVMQNALRDLGRSSVELGIEIVDVRIKQINLPPEVSNSIYQRMRAERGAVAKLHRSQGSREAETIKAQADREVVVKIATAEREARRLMGEGDAEATRIYADAYSQNPELFDFLRSMDAYRKSMASGNDVMVLEPDSEFFRYFNDPKGGNTSERNFNFNR